MPVHHMKGKPAASTYVWEKGGVKIVPLTPGHPVFHVFIDYVPFWQPQSPLKIWPHFWN